MNYIDPDLGPEQLQNKVQLNIRYYFCRGGGENIHAFQKDTFELVYDNESKITYVKKAKDELTKNHRETGTSMITGFMPQILDVDGKVHKMCPVHSYENYISKLNPKIPNLWQQPLKKCSFEDPVWYKAVPHGNNPLDTFMSRMSEACDLSQQYTNHCVRVTRVTHLIRTGKFTPKQVMAVSSHKSIHSLSIYERVKSNEKMMMGMCLTYSLLNPEEVHRIKLAHHANAIENDTLEALPPALQPTAAIDFQVPNIPIPSTSAPNNTNEVNPNALDPRNNNILPLENALVPFNSNSQQNLQDQQEQP